MHSTDVPTSTRTERIGAATLTTLAVASLIAAGTTDTTPPHGVTSHAKSGGNSQPWGGIWGGG